MHGPILALVLAGGVAAQTMKVIPPEGAAVLERLEVEAVGPQSRMPSLATLSVTQGTITLPVSFANAETIRVVGPSVISEPVPIGSGARSIRLAPAGRLHVSSIGNSVRVLHLLMRLDGSMLEFRRDIDVTGSREIEIAAPLGTYAAVLDLGPDLSPLLFPEVTIRGRRRWRALRSKSRKVSRSRCRR